MNTSAQNFSESHLSTLDDINRAVWITVPSPEHYLHENIGTKEDLIADPNKTFSNRYGAHRRTLACRPVTTATTVCAT